MVNSNKGSSQQNGFTGVYAQLLNIFKGDMSFVGPRALLPAEIETGKHFSVGAIPMSEIP